MPRVLYIGSGSPWRGGAGYLVRQNLFLRAWADVAELHLAMFDSGTGSVPAYVRNLTPLAAPARPKPTRASRLWGDLRSSTPRMYRGVDPAAARSAVAALRPQTFDAVFAFRIDFAHFAGVIGRPKLLLDVDDPEHKRQRRRLEAVGDVDPRTRRDIDRLEAFEKSAVAAAAVSFVCQPADAVGWKKPPEIVPNCVDVVASPRRAADAPVVLFVGNCAGSITNPNVDGAAWFLAHVWPAILRMMPGARFRLVGPAGDAVRAAAAGVAGAAVVGFVDDLSAEYAAAAVAVAPIRFGTGTRVKILEAFAHACPVVSTLAGAEGIEAAPGRQIELAVGAADFAARTVALLGDPAVAESIGRGGHALAAEKYDRAAEQKKLAGRFRRFFSDGV